MLKVALVGSGNVAHHLGRVISSTHHSISKVVSRNPTTGKNLADELSVSFSGDLHEIDEKDDLVLLCVSDDAIGDVSATIKGHKGIVLHTSGGTSIDTLQCKRKGVMYPFQTFQKDSSVDFGKIPVCIEASSAEDLVTIQTLATSISRQVIQMDSHQRKVLHIAGVFANNFSNHMAGIAEELLKEVKLPIDLLHPLLYQTIQNVKEKGALVAQTGPARRGDAHVLALQSELLKDKEDYLKIYKLVSQSIDKTHANNR